MAKKTAKQVVELISDELKTMSVAELTQAGKDNGFDSSSGFASWKRALLDVAGIDYNQMRKDRRDERDADREASVSHNVTLYSDAKASANRWAVCDENGHPIWFGRFFDDDRDYNGEQSSGELAAAKKAVWLASRVAAAVGGVVRLTLKVDARWLVWANSSDPKQGGKARELRKAADILGVVLYVEHIAGTSNPADKYTTTSGYAKWKDHDLRALATPAQK